MSENDLLEGLTEGFAGSPSPSAPLPTPAVVKVCLIFENLFYFQIVSVILMFYLFPLKFVYTFLNKIQ